MAYKPSVAVLGASGVVGGNMAKFLVTKRHMFSRLALYDIRPGGPCDGVPVTDNRAAATGCDVGFVCVPTLELDDGSADTSIVEEVCGWADCGVFIIRSTVPPGTCERVMQETQRDIVFQPEYLGENPSGNAYNDIGARKWVTLGGTPRCTAKAAAFYTRLYTADCRIMQTDFRTAEMVKYMTNSFLAFKTVYCAEMAMMCEAHSVDYMAARELWLMDERIGRSHTSVYEGNPGYAGKCISPDEFVFLPNGQPIMAAELENSAPNEILSVDPETNRLTTTKVRSCRKVANDTFVRIKIRTGRQIHVSPYHPCWVESMDGSRFHELEAADVKPGDRMLVPLGAMGEWSSNDIRDSDFEPRNLTAWALEEFRGRRVSYHVSERTADEIVASARVCWKAGEISDDKWILAKKWAKRGRVHEETLRLLGCKADHITITRNTFPLDITLDERWAALAGYYCAEGCSTIRKDSSCVVFSFHHDERVYIDETRDMLTALGFNCFERHSRKDKVTCVVSKSSFLAKLLTKYFGCGHNCYSKSVPRFVFDDRRLAREFLRRYFAGDGSFHRTSGVYPHVSAASASKSMMEAIDSLIRKDGILPMRRFALGKPRVDGEKMVSDTWHIFVSHKKSLDKVSDMLLMGDRLVSERHASATVKAIDSPAYESRDGYALIEITDVSEVPNEHGHVVSIETDNHLYITSGGVAIHNCFPKDIAAIIRSSETRGFEPKLMKAADARNDELRREAGLDTGNDQI